MNFASAVFIITGAASGIGRELAIQAARQGALVIAADIDANGLAETLRHAESVLGTIQTCILDVASYEAIAQFAKEVTPTLQNRYLVLINNAGVGLLSGSFDQTEVSDMEWLFTINFWGAVRLTKAFYPYFLDQQRGHIVNLSSVFGLMGFPHQSAYSPAKFALRGFTETLRIELMDTDVRTTCVHPGGINTNIARNLRVAHNLLSTHPEAIDQFAQVARTQPQEAARQILRAIYTKKQRLLIGADARLIDVLVRLFPVAYSRLIKRRTDKAFKALTK